MEVARNTAIVAESPRPIQAPGRVVSDGAYLFINEKGKGIHLINNADPRNPIKTGFLAIPGNYNFMVNNGILYANSYVDLLVFELASLAPGTIADQLPHQPTSRLQHVFHAFWQNETSDEVAFTYTAVPTTEVLDCGSYGEYVSNNEGQLVDISQKQIFSGNEFAVVNSLDSTTNFDGISNLLSEATIAQFTILDGKLYAINKDNLEVYDLINPIQPEPLATHNLGIGGIRLLNYENKLAVAFNGGIFVYEVANTAVPSIGYSIPNASACDPIAFKDGLAFVSKNIDSGCLSEENELIVTEIPEINTSSSGREYPMSDPRGLSFREDLLFFCDGSDGLKIFDVSNVAQVTQNMVAHFKDLNAYDVLTMPSPSNLIIVVGTDGIYQYDFPSQSTAPTALLSKISFN
ncbi:MAG: hypothetical protein IPN76_23745 [Saprospiraceae bacterium]|nr:hypothetical protein [Saprospiraceae bacterium]